MPSPSDLVDLLRLEQLTEDRWRGVSDALALPWVYGGQLVAQSLMAAARTSGATGGVHSVHTTFLRAGTVGAAVTYEVTRLATGRSRSTTQVDACQGDRLLSRSWLSASAAGGGIEHTRTPPSAAPPEGSRDLAEVMAEGHGFWEEFDTLDIRLVPGREHVPHSAAPPSLAWMRSAATLPDDPVLHQAVIAYASDLLLGTAIGSEDPGTTVPAYWRTSLDHTLWFGAPARGDEWLLYEHVSPMAHAARAVIHVAAFDTAGRQVAQASQEALARPAGTGWGADRVR